MNVHGRSMRVLLKPLWRFKLKIRISFTPMLLFIVICTLPSSGCIVGVGVGEGCEGVLFDAATAITTANISIKAMTIM
jgi:hypothetical protein